MFLVETQIKIIRDFNLNWILINNARFFHVDLAALAELVGQMASGTHNPFHFDDTLLHDESLSYLHFHPWLSSPFGAVINIVESVLSKNI